MSKSFREDLTGKQFNRLTVLEFVPDDTVYSFWKCKCDCGNITTVRRDHLKSGTTKSCGCFHSECARKLVVELNTTHNLSNTKLYKIWDGMKDRCDNPESHYYKNYGGRGIIICDEWKNDFISFYNWAMNNGYSKDLTIDRIDVNGNYCPQNCRWVDMKTQCRNRRSNVIVEYEGKKMCLIEAAEKVGINPAILYYRYHKGDRDKRLFRPVKK